MSEEKYDRGFFGPLYELIRDQNITDIDASEGVIFTTDKDMKRKRIDEIRLDNAFLSAFSMRVANLVSLPFNKESPVLEADTDTLRITIVHPSVSQGGLSLSIRRSLPKTRMDEETMVRNGYASKEVISLLKDCVKAHLNLVFIGEPGAGKTECAKFFSTFIKKDERVITIEDNPEWHFGSLSPGHDCVELRIGNRLDYSAAIKASMRLNPKWMMLSEARGREVKRLLEGFSTGVRGMTTLHADDIRKIPDRMLNMAGEVADEGRFINNVYEFIDVGILIKKKLIGGVLRRTIDEIGFFERRNGKNNLSVIFEEGSFTGNPLPEGILKKMKEVPECELSWTEKCIDSDEPIFFSSDRILVSTAENDSESGIVQAWRMDDIGQKMISLKKKGRHSHGDGILAAAGAL